MLRLLRLQARRDRVVLPVWVIGVALLLLASASSVHSTYGDSAERTKVLTFALATPALLALRGEPNGASLGSAVHFQSFAFLAVAVALLNTFLAVRHGRADEERGRRDLLDAAPVGRSAAALATVLLAVVADALFGALAVLGYLGAGLPLPGAVVSAAGLVLTGLGFLGVGMLASEAMPTSRGANGVAVTLVLVAYALRAAGDALGRPDLASLSLRPAWPSTLSPIGWGEAMLPFTEDRPGPLAALAAFAIVGTVLTLVVHRRREAGTSLVAVRPGPPTGGRALVGLGGLALRLARTGLIAWAVGAALLGAVTASLVGAVAKADIDDAGIAAVVHSLGHTRADLATGLLTAILLLAGLLAAAAGVQAVLRAAEEESSGRAQSVLAAPRSRPRWLLAFAGTGAAAVAVVLVATAVAVALGFLARGDGDGAWLAVRQTLVQAPAALALTAVGVLAAAVAPRVAGAVSWAVYGAAAVIGLLGGLLRVPDDVIRFSPIGSVPVLPSDDWGPTAGMVVAVLLLTAGGAAAIRRRDLLA